MKHAFIVRPFGVRSGIDFENVDECLIQEALKRAGVKGGATGQIVEAGDIREDMFQQLLVTDLVIADVSLHNANVFYELGIRHALQPQDTVLIRAKREKPRAERGPEDEIPFDIRGLRYVDYDPTDPGAAVGPLAQAIADTIASDRTDSPVFRLLPDLAAQDRGRFLPVPVAFRDDVELAAKGKRLGLLGLLGIEAGEFPWASEGLRIVGRAQFNLKAWRGAKATLEALSSLNQLDTEANLLLGTVYQRLDNNLDASDQVLNRVLTNEKLTASDRAEAYSLLGRNLKERWRVSWRSLPSDQLGRQALRSAYLLQACEKYTLGFHENLNQFYPGLNALALLTITIELARALPDVWKVKYKSAEESVQRLRTLEDQTHLVAGAVWSALEAKREQLTRTGASDRWFEITLADYEFLTGKDPERIAFLYETALTGAESFFFDSARNQLDLFDALAIFPEKVKPSLAVFPSSAPPSEALARLILFTGHMIDEVGRTPPRFPASNERAAYVAIRDRLEQEKQRTNGAVLAVASAANGGDIVFHEACQDLGIPSRVFLPLPPDRFRTESVSPAGPGWERRFDRLVAQFSSVACLAESDELPLWLRRRQTYNTWQRANMWLLQEALALGAQHLTLLALWDGTAGDGPGGTEHMISLAKQNNASTFEILTGSLAPASESGV